MTLTINGEKRDFPPALSLQQLLHELGLEAKPVIIELNEEALSPSEYESRQLSEHDQIEIITIAAGG